MTVRDTAHMTSVMHSHTHALSLSIARSQSVDHAASMAAPRRRPSRAVGHTAPRSAPMREARCARGSPRGGTRLYMVRPGPCAARGRFALWAVHCVSAAPRQGLRCALNHTAPKVARHAHVGGVAPAYPAVNRLGPFESPRAGVFSSPIEKATSHIHITTPVQMSW